MEMCRLLCRVCLSTKKDVFPMDENFVTNYNMLTNLNVTLLDGLPQDSCQTCLETVKSFIEFREKSITSENTLRKVISTGFKEEKENESNIHKIENSLTENDAFKIDVKPGSDVFKIENNAMDTVKSEIKIEDTNLDNFEYNFDDNSFIEDNNEENKPIIIKVKSIRKKKRITQKSMKKIKSNIIENLPTTNTNQWYCGICPKTFDYRSDFILHIEGHRNCRRCELCQECLNSPSQVFAHRIMHVPKKQHICHICKRAYKSSVYLEFHYRKDHIEGDDLKLSCKYCNTKFDSPKKLNSHFAHIHSDVKFVCDICSKAFQSRANLKSHIRSHSDKKAYVCDLCGFRCKQCSGLKDHKIRKHSAGKVICKNCKRPFENQEHFDKHKKKCRPKIDMCPICGRQFNGNLSKHMSSHSAIPKYECKRCPAKYKTKGGLQSHLDRHDGNRTKQCEYCPAKFYTAAVLIKHRRVHTGEKPYVCKVCSKGFTANFNLKVHMKVHGEYLVVKKQEEITNVAD